MSLVKFRRTECCRPFALGYGVYDEGTGKFIDVGDAAKMEKYASGLKQYFNNYDIGALIGDMNNDGLLTIADATAIQKIIAGAAA